MNDRLDKYFPFLDFSLVALAVVGLITIIGTMGGCDYAVSHGMHYEESNLIQNLIYGFICIVPALIRNYVRSKYGTE